MTHEEKIIEHLKTEKMLSVGELDCLLTTEDTETVEKLKAEARMAAQSVYGKQIYIRGLIEFTNYCKNECYYCGIRRGNACAERYRLTEEQILFCCATGYELGFRTFVLQGGEDPYFTDEKICGLVSAIKRAYPDCAVTLSIGEKERASYQAYFDAGADRYLLRHETADAVHYGKLHPEEMSLKNRMRCLRDLKEIGYQTGCGFMVGSPYQTTETLYEDLMSLGLAQRIEVEYERGEQTVRTLVEAARKAGVLTVLSHHNFDRTPAAEEMLQKDTPFGGETAGTLEMTLRLLSILRLMNPHVLLPATTALGTIHPQGREMGILSGANVVMPNLSPVSVREKYKLYDNKICTGDEAAECRFCMQRRMESIGYEVVTDRGDYRPAVYNKNTDREA